MFKEQVFIIVIMNIHTSFCALDVVYDAGKQLWNVYTIIDKMELPNVHNVSGSKTFSDSETIIQQMDNGIDKIDEQLKLIENSLKPRITINGLKSLPLNAMLFKEIDTFEIFTSIISENYAQFQRCRTMKESFCAESDLDTEGYILMVRRTIIQEEGEEAGDLPSAITGFLTIFRERICDSPQIFSNILIQLFKMVVIAEIKAKIMITFINVHKYIQKSEGRRQLLALNTRDKMILEVGFSIYLNKFLLDFSLLDTTYWRACDPANGLWIRGETFFEMEKTFQATLFRYHWYNCKYDSCHDVLVHKSYQCKPDHYDHRTSCDGLMTSCSYLSAIEACVLKKGPYRFQYVNSAKRGKLGTNFECPKDDGYMIQDGTGWNISYAACTCNCLGNDNKISLLIMESQVKFNHIIVGLRFVRQNGILYIQPLEAKLEANGYVDKNAKSWISIPTNIGSSLIHRIDKDNGAFFLDDLRLPPSYVLTGVKFNKVTRGNVTGFAIQIFGVPFDYKSGKLCSQKESRISKQASNEALGESLSFEPVNSIYSVSRNKVSPSGGNYVLLQQSRLEEDFGQSTLPLFDSTPISIRFPSALSGIGLFHKGVEGYAGFISLRVFGIKYEKYFQDFKSSHMKNGRVFFNDSNNH